jgi:hypothetical protein
MQKIIGTLLMVVIGLGFSGGSPSKADEYAQRPTVEMLNNVQGTVNMVEGDEPVFVIQCPQRYLRLQAYNLPARYQRHGLAVWVSGNIKATNTLEDGYGELFEVTAIR